MRGASCVCVGGIGSQWCRYGGAAVVLFTAIWCYRGVSYMVWGEMVWQI